MLHLLWVILKIILSVIGILLAIVLLLILLVLFCPIIYEASGVKPEKVHVLDAHGEAKVSWLFKGIVFRVIYRDGKAVSEILLFGIPLDKITRKLNRKKNKAQKTGSPEPAVVSDYEEQEESTEMQEESAEMQGESIEMQDESEEMQDVSEESGKRNIFLRMYNAVGRLSRKIHKIRVKAEYLMEKAEWWGDFITDERTGFAISCVMGESGRILKHILPDKVYGHVTFGFEDPSITGRILAAAGMTLPFHKNSVELHPIFEEKDILDADVRLKGSIYMIRFLISAVRILLNKDVWFVYKTLKHKEE